MWIYFGLTTALTAGGFLTRAVRTLAITGMEGTITVEYIKQKITVKSNERLY